MFKKVLPEKCIRRRSENLSLRQSPLLLLHPPSFYVLCCQFSCFYKLQKSEMSNGIRTPGTQTSGIPGFSGSAFLTDYKPRERSAPSLGLPEERGDAGSCPA